MLNQAYLQQSYTKNEVLTKNIELLKIDSCTLFNSEFNSEYSSFFVEVDHEFITLFDYSSCYLYKYDLDGKFLAKIFIHKFSDNSPLLVESFQTSNNFLFFLKTIRLYYYDYKGYKNSGKLNVNVDDGLINKKWGANPQFFADLENKIFILPISVIPEDLIGNEQRWVMTDYYKSPGLFAIYDISGLLNSEVKAISDTSSISIQRVIGLRDHIYWETEFLPHMDNLNWSYDSKSMSIYYAESATYLINQCAISGNMIRSFGMPGGWLESNDSIVTLNNLKETRPEISIQLNEAKLNSLMYENVYCDNETLYRLYSNPSKDTTKGIIDQRERLNAQDELINNRKRYLQVYNIKNDFNLVQDIPLPPKFKIITIINGVIYANPFFDTSKKEFKIYKYIFSSKSK